jgi:predicted CxxxxCH...CXXCH cytochrome family protein
MKNKFTLVLSLTVLTAWILVGCKSELNNVNDLPKKPVLSGVHGPDVLDATKAGFHGKLLTLGQMTMSNCLSCHSFDSTGGAAKKSCFESGCHLGSHGKGMGDTASANFHAKIIVSLNWKIADCARCHGTDYAGGVANKTCEKSGCHVAADGGPIACYTCHGDPVAKTNYPAWYPTHGTHLNGGRLSALQNACADCHNVPATFADPTHIGANPGHPTVNIKNAVALTVTKGTTGTPSFDPVTGTCKNVYCHGNFTNGNNFTPNWKGQDQAKCGTCHGDPATGNPLPKSPHQQGVPITGCLGCHSGVIDGSGIIIDKSKHINGKLNKFGSEVTDW